MYYHKHVYVLLPIKKKKKMAERVKYVRKVKNNLIYYCQEVLLILLVGLTYYTTGKEIFVNNFSFLKLWQLLTGANLMFLLLDVCLPAWDFTNDLMITTKYWMNASFDWVKSFDKIIS